MNETMFPIGTRRFHDELNMNYTMNRIWAINGGDSDEISQIASGISSTEDWVNKFSELIEEALVSGNKVKEAAYTRAVHFYLSSKHPQKLNTYRRCVKLYRSIFNEYFENGTIQEHRIPYGDGWLPVWEVAGDSPNEDKSAVVLHLGYDSIKEELFPIVQFFKDAGLHLYLFEGPGQGEALHEAGLVMNPRWEECVSVVLDHFNLSDVTLIGLSLGGYLAPRAAACEPRVKRVIAWGVMWDFFETVISRRGRVFEIFLKGCMFFKASWLIDSVCESKMKNDSYARWGIEQGMHIFGVDTPYQYFQKLSEYTTRAFSSKLTQDFLLIGSTEDHFIPEKHFFQQAEALKNVASFTGRRFTSREFAENHVSFSNLPLVVKYMISWIKEHTEDKK